MRLLRVVAVDERRERVLVPRCDRERLRVHVADEHRGAAAEPRVEPEAPLLARRELRVAAEELVVRLDKHAQRMRLACGRRCWCWCWSCWCRSCLVAVSTFTRTAAVWSRALSRRQERVRRDAHEDASTAEFPDVVRSATARRVC